ncbi:ABC transporter permease subunit [Clostridium perfringens]|uniref:ABC transporter permease subunit n=1 Tax=Clostridium perfringens TaxID=1502 RepID=UPI001F3AADB9|nr:ABC transporter permease subunit [Clostridium perfringens]
MNNFTICNFTENSNIRFISSTYIFNNYGYRNSYINRSSFRNSCFKGQILRKPILGFVNLVQAVPSMALLGLLIPILGIGSTPAIFMVVVYSLLPIVKNTYTGISGIDPVV